MMGWACARVDYVTGNGAHAKVSEIGAMAV
jgi:hypothetical protein